MGIDRVKLVKRLSVIVQRILFVFVPLQISPSSSILHC